jgi:hypothetical protein
MTVNSLFQISAVSPKASRTQALSFVYLSTFVFHSNVSIASTLGRRLAATMLLPPIALLIASTTCTEDLLQGLPFGQEP